MWKSAKKVSKNKFTTVPTSRKPSLAPGKGIKRAATLEATLHRNKGASLKESLLRIDTCQEESPNRELVTSPENNQRMSPEASP